MEQQPGQTQGESQEKPQEPTVTPEQLLALQEQLAKFESSNARLLDESKENKNKYQTLKSERENEERTKLEEDGNLSELVAELKNEIHGLKVENRGVKVTSAANALRVEVAKHANGVIDVDDVVRNLDRSLLSLDEENLTYGGVQEAVAKVKKDRPHYWNSKPVSGMVGGRPIVNVPKEQTINERIEENPGSVLNEALGILLSKKQLTSTVHGETGEAV